jgi:L-lactate dehydrogenase
MRKLSSFGSPRASHESPRADQFQRHLQGAALVIITAGANEKTGLAANRNDPAGRLRLLDTNVEVYKNIVLQLHTVEPQALVLVVTDSPDPVAEAVRVLGHERVLSTGTYLDSLRFPVSPRAPARGKLRVRRCSDNR